MAECPACDRPTSDPFCGRCGIHLASVSAGSDPHGRRTLTCPHDDFPRVRDAMAALGFGHWSREEVGRHLRCTFSADRIRRLGHR